MVNPGRVSPDTPFPGTGEFVYTQADFEVVSALIHAHAGIVMPREKAMLIFSRFTKLLRARGMRVFSDYVELIRHDAAERKIALESLTTNHTAFFREVHHFHHFEEHVRDALIEKLAAKKRVRLWSSAASTGEEVYSLALTLLGTNNQVARQILSGDLAILATDLAQHCIDAGMRGQYPVTTLKDIPGPLASLWTTTAGSSFTIDKRIRDLVRFRRLNLLDPWPIKQQFDVIFCRNVMIYFDEPTKETLLHRLTDHLLRDGILYIGHSERVPPSVQERLAPVGQTTFRKIGS